MALMLMMKVVPKANGQLYLDVQQAGVQARHTGRWEESRKKETGTTILLMEI